MPGGHPETPVAPLGPRGVSPLGLALGLHLLILAGLFAWSHAVRDELPERLPIHFASDGTPNGWTRTTTLTWMAMPLTGLGVMVLLAFGLARVVRSTRKHPRWLNLRRKEEFLALPAERQEPVWRAMEALPALLSLPVQGLLVFAQLTIHRAATTGGKGLAVPPLAAFLAVEGVLLVAGLLWVHRRLRRALACG
jgi:hypothetical protein